MRLWTLFAGLVVPLVVAACSDPVPMATATNNATGKMFAAPAPGEAAIYVYCDRDTCPTTAISLNGQSLGLLKTSTWLRVALLPGTHNLQCRITDSSDTGATLPITVAAGDIAFVSTRHVPQGSPACALYPETQGIGRAAVLNGDRVRAASGAGN
jgi:hypothetical protein